MAAEEGTEWQDQPYRCTIRRDGRELVLVEECSSGIPAPIPMRLTTDTTKVPWNGVCIVPSKSPILR